MTGADEMYGNIMRETNNVFISDTDETIEEQESVSSHEQADLNDIPPSLLSYFETSKSRAAVCEKLILEEPEDFTTSHHTEDTMNVLIELDKDIMKLNEQVICDTENEQNTSTDTRLLPAPTGTEALFAHNVSACPDDEDEAGTDEYMKTEKRLAFQVGTLESSLNEEERKKSSEYKAEREKQHCEEMTKEKQKRQIERDFQEELRKIIEAEKLHQKELELMEKRAQEKLEQEFLLQQELISNLQRRVAEERRMREEEQRRLKYEKEERKREEEKIKMEAEKKRMEEEARRKKEEERIKEELKLKKEEERKNEEEKKRSMKREEKRKREEERNRIDLEKKKFEDEMRMMKEEEERKNKEEEERKNKKEVERIKREEEERGKREEERKRIEVAGKEMEKEKRKMEEEMSVRKEEEWLKKDEERKKREAENMIKEEERRVTKETEERKKQEEITEKEEEDKSDERKKMAQEKMTNMYKREHRSIDRELKPEEGNDRKQREEEKEGERKREMERKQMQEKMDVKGAVSRELKEELMPIKEDETGKKEDDKKIKEEERNRGQKAERRRQPHPRLLQRDDEDYRKLEEMRCKEGCKVYDVDNRKMEFERKTEDKEKKQEEVNRGKKEEEMKEFETDNEQNGENMGEKKVDKTTEEEMRLKEKGQSQKTMVQDGEKEVRVLRANELQEKRAHSSMMGQNENNNADKTENSSHIEDGTPCTSSNPPPSHSESTVCPMSTESTPQQHHGDENISQSSTDKTVDCENQAARPSTVSAYLPACLPEHTEQRRLSWMKDCISWSKLSLQNRRKQKGSVGSRRGSRRAAEAGSLPPLCPNSLLQSTGWKSLHEVTTVTLEDLPGCSLSTLVQCTQLQSLSLRRCGLKSLEGISQLSQLCYIDVQENDISFVDCTNMTSLRVLRLGHNKLTSIHGLTGAENLDVLDLSHNSITRIAGLESVKRLQRLSVDHNQLISTKGLRDVYTLLHLNCSHNHLASVEGLENSALLNTLDLRANSLTELPSLTNQVLLRQLHLDDNSISSLQGLTACWLPLMHHLSVAQNGITQLPLMSDCVSLSNLDLRFNCITELQNVCKSLEGCQFLQEVHLTGNPLQQESGWRSTVHRAVPGLKAIDNQETDSFPSPPVGQQVSLVSDSFLTFCQAQLQQTRDLQQQHSREFSKASSSLDAIKTSCQHFTEALQLAMDQRFAHEYGDTAVADKHRAAGQTVLEETLDMDSTNAEKQTERPEMASTGKVPPVMPNMDNVRRSYWTFDETSAAKGRHDASDTVTTGPKTGPTTSKANSGRGHSLARKRKTIAANLEMASVSNHEDLDLQNTAAVMIQQLWRKYRQKCGNISSPSTAEKGGGRGGDGGKPGPSYINRSVVGQDDAATVIQAFWRGFSLRRRLKSALAAVTYADIGEDDTFEEVDVDEFVFDEAALEEHWTLPLSEDSPPRRYPVSDQPPALEPCLLPSEPSDYILPPPHVWRSKQAWVPAEQVESAGQRVSPMGSNRSKSPSSASVVSGHSERSEHFLEEWGFGHSHTALQMLKRAQNMKPKKHQQKKHQDPSIRLALFKKCSSQPGPLEARNRAAQHNRNDLKVHKGELGLQQAEKKERLKQKQTQWLHTQAGRSDMDSESVHFLPEISSDILNGGRVQLVADPGYTERLHHASGLWANSSLTAQPCKENNYPCRNSLGHAREEVPSPKRVLSAPSKKERISFRDNPVQLSGGWGGGKKRDRVHK